MAQLDPDPKVAKELDEIVTQAYDLFELLWKYDPDQLSDIHLRGTITEMKETLQRAKIQFDRRYASEDS